MSDSCEISSITAYFELLRCHVRADIMHFAGRNQFDYCVRQSGLTRIKHRASPLYNEVRLSVLLGHLRPAGLHPGMYAPGAVFHIVLLSSAELSVQQQQAARRQLGP